MSEPDFQNLPTRLGVYTLTELLGSHSISDFYLATQSHMERGVVVQVLRPGSDKTVVDYFLRMVRAKSAAELPRVSRVLESMMSGNVWFLTHERPEGRSLAEMARDGVQLSVKQVCRLISAAAELYNAAHGRDIAMGPLHPDSIYVHGEDDVHFLSPVLPGKEEATSLHVQMVGLADALEPVLPHNVPGQTRVATLVQWIREGYEGEHLDWNAVGSTAAIICEQVTPLLNRDAVQHMSSRTVALKVESIRARRQMRRNIILGSVGALVVLAMAGLGVLCAPGAGGSLPARDNGYVYCLAEDGQTTVRVMDRPVSIREYQRFLAEFEDPNMGINRRNAINRGVPADCGAHTPADWLAQQQAAEKHAEWQGMKLSLDSPVRGVSWWDAVAYANYAGGGLPPAAMLEAVRGEVGGEPRAEEWTATQTPAGAVYPAGRVVLPAAGQETFLETDDKARSVRRSFRITLPVSTTD